METQHTQTAQMVQIINTMENEIVHWKQSSESTISLSNWEPKRVNRSGFSKLLAACLESDDKIYVIESADAKSTWLMPLLGQSKISDAIHSQKVRFICKESIFLAAYLTNGQFMPPPNGIILEEKEWGFQVTQLNIKDMKLSLPYRNEEGPKLTLESEKTWMDKLITSHFGGLSEELFQEARQELQQNIENSAALKRLGRDPQHWDKRILQIKLLEKQNIAITIGDVLGSYSRLGEKFIELFGKFPNKWKEGPIGIALIGERIPSNLLMVSLRIAGFRNIQAKTFVNEVEAISTGVGGITESKVAYDHLFPLNIDLVTYQYSIHERDTLSNLKPLLKYNQDLAPYSVCWVPQIHYFSTPALEVEISENNRSNLRREKVAFGINIDKSHTRTSMLQIGAYWDSIGDTFLVFRNRPNGELFRFDITKHLRNHGRNIS